MVNMREKIKEILISVEELTESHPYGCKDIRCINCPLYSAHPDTMAGRLCLIIRNEVI